MSKTKLYKDILARAKKAITAEYFLEACWLQYAVIEDRLNSVIRHAHPTNGARLLTTLRGMDKKLEHVTKRIHPQDEDCRTTVHKELLGRIEKWKGLRNDLMHEIADSPNYATVQAKVKTLANQGTVLVNDLCNRTRKFKAAVQKRSPNNGVQSTPASGRA